MDCIFDSDRSIIFNPDSFDGLEYLNSLFLNNVNKNIEQIIKEHQKENQYDFNKYWVLKKYLWLRELLRWNQDKNSSKIKFEYVFDD